MAWVRASWAVVCRPTFANAVVLHIQRTAGQAVCRGKNLNDCPLHALPAAVSLQATCASLRPYWTTRTCRRSGDSSSGAVGCASLCAHGARLLVLAAVFPHHNTLTFSRRGCDAVYLDTTYCNPRYRFPAQARYSVCCWPCCLAAVVRSVHSCRSCCILPTSAACAGVFPQQHLLHRLGCRRRASSMWLAPSSACCKRMQRVAVMPPRLWKQERRRLAVRIISRQLGWMQRRQQQTSSSSMRQWTSLGERSQPPAGSSGGST